MNNRVDLNQMKHETKVFICANKNCIHYDMDAVMMLYPSSIYCSMKCKYNGVMRGLEIIDGEINS